MLNTKKKHEIKDKWCVIVPTFNNEKTLRTVLTNILDITPNVILINDGSNDNTSNIIAEFKNSIDIITHKKNIGKGKSLRDGFEYAIKKEFDYAITIDSDGQHYPEDISLFLDMIKKHPRSLIVGARNMKQDNIPKKSSFGNNFSNFWFWVETGITLSDTQTGFRLYPLNKMKNISFFTNKFEFEIEVLTRMAWRGVNIKEVPIKVKYDLNERISHFRPFMDFLRISLLNTLFVAIALFYFIPLRLINYFFNKENIKSIVIEFFSQKGSNLHKSLSIGLGVLMGILPIWGFQMLAAVFLSYVFKLNKIIVLAFSNISIPPAIPFIIFGSYYLGHLITGGEELTFSMNIDLQYIKAISTQYIIGSIMLAILSGLISFLSSYLILNLLNKSQKKK
tara:strand:- start:305 stop:1483 length:1179 start_codon:yes stop_codon:yes gene_type:complete